MSGAAQGYSGARARETAFDPASSCFVAIDFETADNERDSACAVALVRVEAGQVVRAEARLIRPPRCVLPSFTEIHGITDKQLRSERPFRLVWPELAPMLEGASFLVAHNASFDQEVLDACCERTRLPKPALQWACTVQIARRRWPHWSSHKLNLCCDRLGIPLKHHDPMSDALACAEIYLRAQDLQLVRTPPRRPAPAATAPSGKAALPAEMRPHPPQVWTPAEAVTWGRRMAEGTAPALDTPDSWLELGLFAGYREVEHERDLLKVRQHFRLSAQELAAILAPAPAEQAASAGGAAATPPAKETAA